MDLLNASDPIFDLTKSMMRIKSAQDSPIQVMFRNILYLGDRIYYDFHFGCIVHFDSHQCPLGFFICFGLVMICLS